MDYFNSLLSWFILFTPTAALLWLMWLYVLQYKEVRQLRIDNYRLIRRLGQYHSIALTTPSDSLPILEPEPSVPPAFRARKPTKDLSVTDQARIAQGIPHTPNPPQRKTR